MRPDNVAEADVDGQSHRLESAGIAVWTAFRGHGVGDDMAWFHFVNGNVDVKNPGKSSARCCSSLNASGRMCRETTASNTRASRIYPASTRIKQPRYVHGGDSASADIVQRMFD
jgi:hypothetical protein